MATCSCWCRHETRNMTYGLVVDKPVLMRANNDDPVVLGGCTINSDDLNEVGKLSARTIQWVAIRCCSAPSYEGTPRW